VEDSTYISLVDIPASILEDYPIFQSGNVERYDGYVTFLIHVA
jgi:hypothetical protein